MQFERRAKTVSSAREIELIEILVGLHQGIHHLKRRCRIDIVIQFTVYQQQLALEKVRIVNI